MEKPLGELEQAILLAVLRLGDGAYGLSIREELERETGRSLSHGAAYATLDRLLGKGMLESTLGESTPNRGGKRKRYFTATSVGVEALRNSREALFNLWSGLEGVFEDPSG